MSIRLILSVALLATIQCAHAEKLLNLKSHDIEIPNTQRDMIYEQPEQTGVMTKVSLYSLTKTQRVALDSPPTSTKAAMLRAMLGSISEYEDINQFTHLPLHSYSKLVLRQNTRFQLGRAVLKYNLSNRKHAIEKRDARRRLVSAI